MQKKTIIIILSIIVSILISPSNTLAKGKPTHAEQRNIKAQERRAQKALDLKEKKIDHNSEEILDLHTFGEMLGDKDLTEINYGDPEDTTTSTFPDVLNFYYFKTAVEYTVENNIVQGYPDGMFRPYQNVSRREFLKILIGTKLGGDPKQYRSQCFPDINEEEWVATYACYAKEQGIISGFEDGTFQPGNNITFQEASKIFVKTFTLQYQEDTLSPWYHQYIEALSQKQFIPGSIHYPDSPISRSEMVEMVWRIKENIQDRPYYQTADNIFELAKRRIAATEEGRCATQDELTTITFPILNLATNQQDSHSLTVHKNFSDDLNTLFNNIFEAGFPINKATTHAFTCRNIGVTNRLSQHAFGTAIDINADINPMMRSDGTILVGSSYDPSVPGTITADSIIVDEFNNIGWGWLGPSDYMHFSLTGG